MNNHNKSRRTFLKSVGLGFTALSCPSMIKACKKSKSLPNIIFIVVDDMGYADLGCFGSKVIQTPRIDQMAEQGMKFTQFYSGCTVCAPARSTLLTGKHMGHTTVRGNTGGVSLLESDITIGEVMKKAGYATAGFGKWGLGDLDTPGVPEKHGFDTFFGYYHQIHAHYYYPEYLIHNGKKIDLPGNKDGKKEQYTHYIIFEEMKKFIRENKNQPFFCYAPWTPPHGHYEIPDTEPAMDFYKDKNWPRKTKVIAAMDSMIDRNVGEIIDLLRELGIDKNTLIFFCSDNGAADRQEGYLDSSGPLRGQKRAMYEGGLRSPMIAYWPGKIEPGTVSDLQWYFPDVLPTMADFAKANTFLPNDIDGISVKPTLTNEGEQIKHDCLYWEWPVYNWGKRIYPENGLMQAVRCGDWKMLRHKKDQSWELYDLSDDIGEQNNIADQHPEIISKLSNWIKENRMDPVPQIEPPKPEGRIFR
jgi:arylsulfatase A-like enzyme